MMRVEYRLRKISMKRETELEELRQKAAEKLNSKEKQNKVKILQNRKIEAT